MKNLAYKIRLMLLGVFVSLSFGTAAQMTSPPTPTEPTFTSLTVTGDAIFNRVGGSTVATIKLGSTLPLIRWQEDAAAADEGVWRMFSNAASWKFDTRTDANTAGTTFFEAARTGTTVDTINLTATTVQTNGADATHETGTFSVTWDGGCSGGATAQTWNYAKAGDLVTLTPFASQTCTSNTATLDDAGAIPVGVRPVGRTQFFPMEVFDNSALVFGCIEIGTAGGISLHANSTCNNGFTSSGLKGTASRPYTITYMRN